MTEMMERSHALRDDTTTHYNCAQAVFIPFAEKKGLSSAQAQAITANFGGGMRAGLTCGAITGGLMALGLYDAGDAEASTEFMRRMKSLHGGLSDCCDLLREEVHGPAEKKPHCDGMVYEAVEIVEEMLTARGLL